MAGVKRRVVWFDDEHWKYLTDSAADDHLTISGYIRKLIWENGGLRTAAGEDTLRRSVPVREMGKTRIVATYDPAEPNIIRGFGASRPAPKPGHKR